MRIWYLEVPEGTAPPRRVPVLPGILEDSEVPVGPAGNPCGHQTSTPAGLHRREYAACVMELRLTELLARALLLLLPQTHQLSAKATDSTKISGSEPWQDTRLIRARPRRGRFVSTRLPAAPLSSASVLCLCVCVWQLSCENMHVRLCACVPVCKCACMHVCAR